MTPEISPIPVLSTVAHVSSASVMCLFFPAGGSVVPVQYNSRKPAAGAGCNRCWSHTHDHSPACQGKMLSAYPAVHPLFPFCSFILALSPPYFKFAVLPKTVYMLWGVQLRHSPK